MHAMEVTLNGKKICTAGLPDFGVVTCILSGTRRDRTGPEDALPDETWKYEIDVGGLHSPEPGVGEFLRWHMDALATGDEVVVRLVEVEDADEPLVEKRRETDEDMAAMKRAYLEDLKKQVARLTEELGEDG